MTNTQIKSHLSQFPNWNIDQSGKIISRSIMTKNFVTAVELINKIKDLAENVNHHPDLHLTDYKNLLIELTSHSVGESTEKDFTLAKKIENII